jgi:GNAT superfamily N-acetyltransferase
MIFTNEINSHGIVYRKADINDINTLINFRIQFLNELYNRADDEKTQVLRGSLHAYFTKAIRSNEFIAWLAEYKRRIIGTSGLVIWERPANYEGLESGKLGYLLNFYTIPEARGKGVCTQLLGRLIEEAKLIGLKYLHLNATRKGINIYRKAGFVEPSDKGLELRL